MVLALVLGASIIMHTARTANTSGKAQPHQAAIVFSARGKTVASIDSSLFDLNLPGEKARFRRVARNLIPRTMTVRTKSAAYAVDLERDAAVNEALASATHGGPVNVATTTQSVRVNAPVLKQALRNNCEAAALQVLLATIGVRVPQLQLQREVTKSGSLDPIGSGPNKTWGDPDVGFVGRADGGGIAGGFGVYPGPIRRLASRHSVDLKLLTGAPASKVYATLLAGRAVMVWVGLADGPFEQWRSPAGRTIRVNLNEHTVVLAGIDSAGMLTVVNPLSGKRETWSKSEFESGWQLLGRRALTT